MHPAAYVILTLHGTSTYVCSTPHSHDNLSTRTRGAAVGNYREKPDRKEGKRFVLFVRLKRMFFLNVEMRAVLLVRREQRWTSNREITVSYTDSETDMSLKE